MEEEVNVQTYIEPVNIILAFLFGILGFLVVMGSIGTFGLEKDGIITLSSIVAGIYFIVLFFLLRTKVRVIEKEKETIIEKQPIIKTEIIKEKPIIKRIVKTIEKPVEKHTTVLVDRLPKEEKKEVKPRKRYDYVGSKLTQTYHLAKCRLGKSIKGKYKIQENDKKYFKLRGYKACKVCKP